MSHETNHFELLFLIGCVQGAACQDQRSKASSDAVRGDGPVRSACAAEIEKFCRSEERTGSCLRDQNQNEISEGCKIALSSGIAVV
jgi:hypothetical protein